MASVPDALAAVAGWLRCPVCRVGLRAGHGVLRCEAGHSFDVARQGYVNLMQRPAPANADTAEMVAARHRFLSRGHYAPLADAIADAAAGSRRIVEVGAGTGYYVAHCLERAVESGGLATDVSPAAARRAARAHPRLAAVVADTWAGLPLADGAADALLCVFAPRNPAEFARILAPAGRLVVAVPGPAHLAELRAAHGLLDIREQKLAEVTSALADVGLTHVASRRVRAALQLDAASASDLVAMGPNAFHRASTELPAQVVSLDVDVATFSPRG